MSHAPSVAKIASSAFYYNEFDPHAAQWIRNLIAAGHLPAGEVDERSIVDVSPADLAGFRQCHFFAGVGGWPLALRALDDYPAYRAEVVQQVLERRLAGGTHTPGPVRARL